jgi:NADH-quinone oxidoreductase subunit L
LHKFWLGGWGFDTLYNTLIVAPFLFLARINRKDLIDSFYVLIVTLAQAANGMIVKTQTGSLRWYALTLVAGLVIIVTLGVLL